MAFGFGWFLREISGRGIATAGVKPERDVHAGPPEQTTEPRQLIVGQGVHGVNEHGLDALQPGLFAPKDAVENGKKKRFRFPGARSRGDDKGFFGPAGFQCPFPVAVEGVVFERPFKFGEAFMGQVRPNELLESLALSEIAGKGDKRPFNDDVGLVDIAVELFPELRVKEAVGRFDEPAIFVFEVLDDLGDGFFHGSEFG